MVVWTLDVPKVLFVYRESKKYDDPYQHDIVRTAPKVCTVRIITWYVTQYTLLVSLFMLPCVRMCGISMYVLSSLSNQNGVKSGVCVSLPVCVRECASVCWANNLVFYCLLDTSIPAVIVGCTCLCEPTRCTVEGGTVV